MPGNGKWVDALRYFGIHHGIRNGIHQKDLVPKFSIFSDFQVQFFAIIDVQTALRQIFKMSCHVPVLARSLA